MAEQVQTGGLMKFDYTKQRTSELEAERKEDIEIGYREYDERKKRERRRWAIFWIILFLLILLTVGYFILKN